MNGKLRIATSIVCLALSTAVVALAYFNNYESVVTRTSEREIIMLLLLINVIANIAQIEEFFEKVFDDRMRDEQKLYEMLHEALENLKVILKEEKKCHK
jgi:hypothetical protein